MQLELDRRPTSGALEVSCAGLSQTFPFQTPAGYSDAALALPLIIPVLKQGSFKLTIRDGGAPDTPRTIAWRLQFAPGAQPVTAKDAGERIASVAQREADTIAAQLTQWPGATH